MESIRPGKKKGSRISLERFAYLQLFGLRKKADPKLALVKFDADLRRELLEVEEGARKQGHKL